MTQTYILIVAFVLLMMFSFMKNKLELTLTFKNHKYFTAGIYPPPVFGFGYTTVDYDGKHHVVWIGPISFAYGEQGRGLSERVSP